MRSTSLVEFLFHVKVQPHCAAAVARGLAVKVYHNRAGDARYGSHGGQVAHRIWSHRGQHWDLHGLCIDELRPSSINLNIILHLAFLGQELVARVAWVEKSFKATYVAEVAVPVVKMAKLLSLMVHLASAAGDPHTLVIASTYIFMIMMANRMGLRPAAGWRFHVPTDR